MTLGLDEQKKKKSRVEEVSLTSLEAKGGSVMLKSGGGHSGLRQQSPGGWKQSLREEQVGGQVGKTARGLAGN